MKNPPILFAKQANIAAGPQQVNWTATSLLARMPAFGQEPPFGVAPQLPQTGPSGDAGRLAICSRRAKLNPRALREIAQGPRTDVIAVQLAS
jgi:hypothetical protein